MWPFLSTRYFPTLMTKGIPWRHRTGDTKPRQFRLWRKVTGASCPLTTQRIDGEILQCCQGQERCGLEMTVFQNVYVWGGQGREEGVSRCSPRLSLNCSFSRLRVECAGSTGTTTPKPRDSFLKITHLFLCNVYQGLHAWCPMR